MKEIRYFTTGLEGELNHFKNISFLLFCVLFFQSSSHLWAYRWPLDPQIRTHGITGTLGEFRSNHFHEGVDLPAKNGTKVLSVETAVIPLGNPLGNDDPTFGSETFLIGNKRYIHINHIKNDEGKFNFDHGDTVQVGDTVATIRDYGKEGEKNDHLHFEEWMFASDTIPINPLMATHLDSAPGFDTSWPQVIKIYFLPLVKDTTFPENENLPIVSGKIKILARARDRMTGGSDNVAPYLMKYIIKNDSGQVVVEETTFVFSQRPPNDQLLQAYQDTFYLRTDGSKLFTTRSKYYFNATYKRGSSKRFWDTTLLPDGKYRVTVLVKDAAGNGGDVENQRGALTQKVIVSNAKLYIVDNRNKRIQVFDQEGNFLDSIGNNILQNPDDLTIDVSGNVYVSDHNGDLWAGVKKFDQTGNFVKESEDITNGRPVGITTDGTFLYVLAIQDRIYKLDYELKLLGGWGSFGSEYFGIEYSPTNKLLYVNTFFGGLIDRYTTSGNLVNKKSLRVHNTHTAPAFDLTRFYISVTGFGPEVFRGIEVYDLDLTSRVDTFGTVAYGLEVDQHFIYDLSDDSVSIIEKITHKIIKKFYCMCEFSRPQGLALFPPYPPLPENESLTTLMGGRGGPQSDDPKTFLPRVFVLSQNTPNPFSEETVIRYQLPTTSQVHLDIYDVTGRLMSTLVNEKKEAGYYMVKWAGKEIPSGVYFYRLIARSGHGGDFTNTRKLILLR